MRYLLNGSAQGLNPLKFDLVSFTCLISQVFQLISIK